MFAPGAITSVFGKNLIWVCSPGFIIDIKVIVATVPEPLISFFPGATKA